MTVALTALPPGRRCGANHDDHLKYDEPYADRAKTLIDAARTTRSALLSTEPPPPSTYGPAPTLSAITRPTAFQKIARGIAFYVEADEDGHRQLHRGGGGRRSRFNWSTQPGASDGRTSRSMN